MLSSNYILNKSDEIIYESTAFEKFKINYQNNYGFVRNVI